MSAQSRVKPDPEQGEPISASGYASHSSYTNKFGLDRTQHVLSDQEDSNGTSAECDRIHRETERIT